MSAATILADAYGEGACLYATVLGVPADATPAQLRKAYYKACLRHHPDKQPADLPPAARDAAARKFQAVSVAYALLSDPEKRREYDASGEVVDADEDPASGQWTEYFERLFPKVTAADIDAFEVAYKCSDEEQADVLKYYARFEGDLGQMLECVMLSSDADAERWVQDYIAPAIASGAAGDFRANLARTQTRPRTRKTRKTRGKAGGRPRSAGAGGSGSDESETPRAEIVASDDDAAGGGGRAAARKRRPPKKKAASSAASDAALIAQIRGKTAARREAGFDSMMAGLEDRYGGNTSKRKKKHQGGSGDIDDDEFAKIQAKLMKNKKSR